MPHKIRMIVTDLDGTLLRSDKTISEYTRRILLECRQAGIKAAYATARGVSAQRLVPSDLIDGRIIKNGAVAFAGEETIYERLIPHEMARPILTACDARGLKAASELGGMHYSNFDESELWSSIGYSQRTDFRTHDKDAEKLSIVIQSPDDAPFLQSLLPEALYLSVSNDGLAMVMHKDATKSKAIAALASRWAIGAEEIAAFGDDVNDMDMLEFVGRGVAMGNALDKVKAVAREVCGGNDADGVARWIEGNVLCGG